MSQQWRHSMGTQLLLSHSSPEGQVQVPPQPLSTSQLPAHWGVQAWQDWSRQIWLGVAQLVQLSPPLPQRGSVMPLTQDLEVEQQPLGQEVVLQMQSPPTQTWPAGQGPSEQVPPQPLAAPQLLPSHWGVQVMQARSALQAWLVKRQSAQLPPPPPQ